MDELQKKNIEWWNANPMDYDWHKTSPYQEGSKEWFIDVSRRFFCESASFFAQNKGEKPFSKLIPYDLIKGKKVLEIGCGTGNHTKLIAEQGCQLTAIDITPKAVVLTKKRLDLWNLKANVLQMDAENMSFSDSIFDFIWSWGVIHHSSNPEAIVAEMARVLKKGGEARVMVYHKNSICAGTSIVRGLLTAKPFKGYTIQDILSFYSDGFVARFYTQKEATEMFKKYFSEVETSVYGQKSELYPIPNTGFIRRIKSQLISMTPNTIAGKILGFVGSFLFIVAKK